MKCLVESCRKVSLEGNVFCGVCKADVDLQKKESKLFKLLESDARLDNISAVIIAKRELPYTMDFYSAIRCLQFEKERIRAVSQELYSFINEKHSQ